MVFNIFSFRAGSLGQSVSISVSEVIQITEEDPLGLHVDYQDASRALEQFCQWEEEREKSNGDSSHDVAILLTRKDLCRVKLNKGSESCSTLGLGMCASTRTSILGKMLKLHEKVQLSFIVIAFSL